MADEKITVRKQKIKKNHTKGRLIFFSVITVLLLLTAAFAGYLCPYDPDEQNLLLAQQPPSLSHLLGTDRVWQGYVLAGSGGKYDQYLCHAYACGGCDGSGNVGGDDMRLVWKRG